MPGETLYECENPACSLGTVGSPGRFTGGATAAQITQITGDPDLDEHGDGICPNCGKAGVDTGETHTAQTGNDPYDDAHQEVASRVADGRVAGDAAQAELAKAVGDEPSQGAARAALGGTAEVTKGDE
jgi:hypothetical protein